MSRKDTTHSTTHHVTVTKLPPCDFCSGRALGLKTLNPNADKAHWDGPTRFGPWAYMCDRHNDSAGVLRGITSTRLELAVDEHGGNE